MHFRIMSNRQNHGKLNSSYDFYIANYLYIYHLLMMFTCNLTAHNVSCLSLQHKYASPCIVKGVPDYLNSTQ